MENEWIKAADKLPDNEYWYRVCLKNIPYVIPCSYAGGRWYEYGIYASSIPDVTHWKEFNDEAPIN